MENIMSKTRELGEALRMSREYARMREAELGAMTDETSAAAFSDWIAVKTQIGLLLEEAEPNEAELRRSERALKVLDERISSLAPLREWRAARSAFEEVLRLINGELKRMLSGESEAGAAIAQGLMGKSGILQ